MRSWWRTAAFWCSLMSVGMPAGPLGAQSAPAAGDVIGGRVVSAKDGRPLAHALVSLTDTKTERTAGTVVAGEDGVFHFAPVPAGKYRLTGQAAGYLRGAYQGHEQFSTAIVAGAGLPVGDLVLALTPEATVAGKVVDEAGDPVAHANVTLFRQDAVNGVFGVRSVNMANTEDDGSFEFSPLEPGRYFVAANARPWYAVVPPLDGGGGPQMVRSNVDPALDVAYPTLFYPNARSSDEAAPIDLAGGDSFIANLQMVPERAVTLTVRRPPAPVGATPGSATQMAPQLTQMAFGTEHMPVYWAGTQQAGDEVVVQGLAPGRYELQMQQFGPGVMRAARSASTIDIQAGGATVDAGTAAAASATVSAHVRMGDGSGLPRNTSLLMSAPARGAARQPAPSAAVDGSGRADFEDLAPGDYYLRAYGEDRILPVAEIAVAGRAIVGSNLHVPAEAHLEITVTLAKSAATVEGFVQRGGKPAAGELVLLVPAGADATPELFRRDQSDLDGSFELPQVPPGRYLLVALDDGWRVGWSDLHALTPYLLHAQPVTVGPGAAGVIHLADKLAAQTVQ